MEYEPEQNFNNNQDVEPQSYEDPYATTVQERDTASIIKQIDPKNVIESIKNQLKGIVVNDKGKPEQVGRRLLNDEGINYLMSLVHSNVNLNTSLSNLKEDEVYKIMRPLGLVIIENLMIHRNEWQIRHSQDRSMIRQIICNPIYFVLKRAVSEGDKRFLKGQTVEHISRHFQGEKQKSPFAFLRGND